MAPLEGHDAITAECRAVIQRDGRVLLVRDVLGRHWLPGRWVSTLRIRPEEAIRSTLRQLGLEPTRLALRLTWSGTMLFDTEVEGEPVGDLFLTPEWVPFADAQWRLPPRTAFALARFERLPATSEPETEGAAATEEADLRLSRPHGKVPARVGMEQEGKLKPRTAG